MHLDKFSDYALRILMALSVSKAEKLPVSTISARYGLSQHHIAKVATELARGGFVTSDRGRGGGLSLAHAPCDITIGAVLRTTMKNTPVAECFGDAPNCTILPACGLRDPLAQAKEAFFAVLDSVSLADVTRQKRDLADLLKIP